MEWCNGFLAILLCASASCSPVSSGSVTPTIRSEWFFPESKSWTAIEQLPRLDARRFDKLRGLLRSAYDKMESPSKDNNDDCIIASILDEKARTSFRTADINQDGVEDVVYTGSAFCQEGDVTVIWYGTRDGFRIKPNYIWPMRALKIHMADDPDISSYAVGCCANFVDEYFIGKSINPRMSGRAQVYRDTTEPLNASIENRTFQNTEETILRSSPTADDKYDESASGREDRAIFGNMLAKYLGGASGRTIYTQKTKDQGIWAYVIMSEGSNPLRYYVGYEVNVGWIRLQPEIKK